MCRSACRRRPRWLRHPRRGPGPAGLRAQPGWADAETALKETGLIYSSNGPHQVHVSDDVKFSLRYSDDSDIARELGEPPAASGGASPW